MNSFQSPKVTITHEVQARMSRVDRPETMLGTARHAHGTVFVIPVEPESVSSRHSRTQAVIFSVLRLLIGEPKFSEPCIVPDTKIPRRPLDLSCDPDDRQPQQLNRLIL